MDAIKKEAEMDVDSMLYAIWKNRCRKLTESDIKTIYQEIEEEAMNGTNVYEEFTARGEFKSGGNDDLR